MAFETWKFQYTPPPTVSAPVPTTAVTGQSQSLLTGQVSAASSAAGTLIARVAALQEANQYLQSVVLARTAGVTIPFNASMDPETAEAIAKLYPGIPLPTSLSVAMYNNLLDAELTALQVDRALDGTSNEVNPYQTAAVSQIAQAIENGMLGGGQFNTLLPALLRPLKGDNVFLNNLSSQLANYPVISAPASSLPTAPTQDKIILSGQDVSPDLASTLNGALDSFQGSYASVYQVCASVGQVAQDVNNVLAKFLIEPASNLIRMIAMFQSLQALAHMPRLKSIVNGLTGFVFVQLIAEVSGYAVMADRFLQTAIQPIRTMTGEISQMVNQVQLGAAMAETVVKGVKASATTTTGGLKGMSQTYSSGLPCSSAVKQPASPPGLSALSNGLKSVAQHLDWASTEGMRKIMQVDESFHKLIQRRLGDTNNQLSLLNSLQEVQTMVQLAQAVMTFNQTPQQAASTPGFNQLQQVGQILNSTSSSIGTTFVTSNGQMSAVPPSLPIPSSSVQSTLVKGGLNLTVVSSATGVTNAS